jgi:L-serine dehydratase
MESISVFDIFKIGVGPSSSHTMGPWRAAQAFVRVLNERGVLANTARVVTDLYGSLAKTGHGHGTDVAVMLGLSGDDPVTSETSTIDARIEAMKEARRLRLGATPGGGRGIDFVYDRDIVFHMDESLPFHPNGVRFTATLEDGAEVSETYFSVGGGFIVQEGETASGARAVKLPFPIDKAEELARYCKGDGGRGKSEGGRQDKGGQNGTRAQAPASGLPTSPFPLPPSPTIPQVVLENEKTWRPEPDVRAGILRIWRTMAECIYRGCHTEGVLPGGLNVTRRAASMNRTLLYGSGSSGVREYDDLEGWLGLVQGSTSDFRRVLRWVSTFALAVNEENAAFGRVVTAPTNGAAGVIPAVLMYAWCFCKSAGGTGGNIGEQGIIDFLLTAAEIGSLFKKGATLSAAMGGCQAEIGVSSAMAAAGLAQVLGASPGQAMMAAEIAMEHHLGMTCDPIGGLVQVPCIERNTMGAIKAITAAHIALESDPEKARVSLDGVIKTMWETALDMQSKYKETAEGGLAVHVSVGLSEC